MSNDFDDKRYKLRPILHCHFSIMLFLATSNSTYNEGQNSPTK